MKRTLVVAYLTFLESLRRKDFFVLFILAGVIMLMASGVEVFGMNRFDAFVAEISLFVITWSAILIAITSAARQLPAELSNRTLYPLLAKPLGRLQFLLGKFIGVGIMCFFALAFLYVLYVIVLWRTGAQPGWILLQNFYLRFLSLLFLAAMTLFFSLFLTHAANVCLSLLICIGISMFSVALTEIHAGASGLGRAVVFVAYMLLPHFDLFNLNYKTIHGWDPIAGWAILFLSAYAAFYTLLLLGCAGLLFRRQTL